MEKTLGEKRVRVEFNPSGVGNVNFIKEKTAELINVLEAFQTDNITKMDSESFRLVSTAQTAFENAAMWGVKAVTYSLDKPE